MNLNSYLSFFKKELTDNLLFFWMDRCLDKENGGYLNCFTNGFFYSCDIKFNFLTAFHKVKPWHLNFIVNLKIIVCGTLN